MFQYLNLNTLFTTLGWTRDDSKWLWAKVVSVAGLIVSGTLSIPYLSDYLAIPISPAWEHRIAFFCVVILILSGKMDSSKLPADPVKKVERVQDAVTEVRAAVADAQPPTPPQTIVIPPKE